MNSATDPGTCPSCLVQDAISRYNYGYNYPGIQIALYTTSYVNRLTRRQRTSAVVNSRVTRL